MSTADLESLETLRPAAPSVVHVPERRANLRFVAGADAELDQPTWSTVNLVDVSTTGVLFSSPVPLDVGERGELRVRFGEGSFAAQLEVRRTEVRKTPHLGYRAGAVFVSLDDVSRLHLEDFIGDARH